LNHEDRGDREEKKTPFDWAAEGGLPRWKTADTSRWLLECGLYLSFSITAVGALRAPTQSKGFSSVRSPLTPFLL